MPPDVCKIPTYLLLHFFGGGPKMDWENIKPVLTGEEQTIVWLHYGEGYSYAEIAEILGKKVGTIRQKGSRAKEKLRSSFPELCGSY